MGEGKKPKTKNTKKKKANGGIPHVSFKAGALPATPFFVFFFGVFLCPRSFFSFLFFFY